MKITFHIQELGRLKDTSFDLHPLLVFTGDSNLGKSYCAFLVYGFLKSLETELFSNFIATLFDMKTLAEKVKAGETVAIVFEMKQLETFFNENIQGILGSLIGYEDVNCKVYLEISGFQNIELSLSFNKNNTLPAYNINSNIESDFSSSSSYNENNNSLSSSLTNHLRQYISYLYGSDLFLHKKVFIFPPARGSILGASYSVQNAIANTRMYVEFLQDMDKLRQPDFGKTEINPEIMEKIKVILEGEIKTRQNEIYYHFDNQSIPITAAASSIKELVPLFLLLKKYQPSAISLLFEEPESHLHPSMQKKLADLLAYMINNGSFLQITTHSSYFLTEWNNLLRLHFIKEKSETTFQEALAETGLLAECVLNPAKVGAYYFEVRNDGSVQLVKSEITENEQIQFDTFQETTPKMNENRYILMDKIEQLNEKKYEETN